MKNKKIKSLIHFLKSAGLEKEAGRATSLLEGKTHLFISDFDGTIFRSPMSPALWRGGWWSKIESLAYPCVPEKPGEDWWIPEAVAQAKVAMAEPHTYSVLMTGRKDGVHTARVMELLGQQSLKFDEVKLSTGFDTVAFKSEQIERLLREFPDIKTVKILDDRGSYLETYKKLIKKINPEIEVETVLIAASAKGAECNDESPKEIVLPTKANSIGLFLTSESKGKLLERFPAAYDNIQGENIIVIQKPNSKDLEDMKLYKLLGKKFNIMVTGYAKDDKGQAVTVEVPNVVFPSGIIPQIPISVAESVKPAYTKELLARGNIEPVQDLNLEGIMWWK